MVDAGRAKELLFDALDLPGGERDAFLDSECAGDAALRSRVGELLAAHGDADERMGRPPSMPTIDGPVSSATSTTSRQPGDLSPGDRAGDYLIQEQLGEGGFGTVFRALQEQPVRRAVALKVLKAGMDSRAVVARFEAERQALALMDHPHIARVLDAGTTDAGRPYFVMDLVEGVPITRAVEQRGLGLRERLAVFVLVCHAVQHAHSKGVIHRDLKPGNVLVTEVDSRLEPKVIDFGVAKAIEGRLTDSTHVTRVGHVIGTPATMSPEQIEGASDVDTRADVYALGNLMYELITGVAPFETSQVSLAELCRMVREDDPPRPSKRVESAHGTAPVGRAVPSDLDWIVMRCLEKERSRRYPTALALARDVERFLDQRPVEAAPPSAWYRVTKLARRHRAVAVASIVVVVGLFVGVIGLVVGLVSAQQANEQLNIARQDALDEAERAHAAEMLAASRADAAKAAEQLAAEEAAAARAAEQRAEHQAAVAREGQRVTREVLAFVTDDLLSAASPSGQPGQGRDAMLSDVIAVADSRLRADADQGRFADAPLVEAGMRHAVGRILADLGKHGDALDHLRRAHELRADELGPNHRETFDTLLLLCAAHWGQGNLERAGDLVREGLERLDEHVGPDDLLTLRARHLHAQLLWDEGSKQEAAVLAVETVTRLTEAFGAEHRTTLDAHQTLAQLLFGLGHYADAEGLMREGLALRTEVLGADDPRTLTAGVNLANMLRGVERHAEAQELYADVYERMKRVLGPTHSDVLMAGQGLGRMHVQMGSFDEGETLLRELRESSAAQFSEEHMLTIELTAALGRAVEMQGRIDEALTLYRSAHARASVIMGPINPFTLQRAVEVTSALFALERFDEALPFTEATLAGQLEQLGPEDVSTIRSRMNLGILYIGQGRLDQAEEQMAAALDAMRAVQGPDSHDTLEVQSNYGGLLIEMRRYPEALEVLDDCLARSQRVMDGAALPVLILRLRRGATLTAMRRFDEAEVELLGVEKIVRPSRSGTMWGIDSIMRLIDLYRALGDDEKRAHWEAELARDTGGPIG